MYALHSLGLNVNLWWGLAMLLFGAVMLLPARGGAAGAGSANQTQGSRRN
jgi:hypothetical protein